MRAAQDNADAKDANAAEEENRRDVAISEIKAAEKKNHDEHKAADDLVRAARKKANAEVEAAEDAAAA